jgi:K+-sensing histidine kinase KdpD
MDNAFKFSSKGTPVNIITVYNKNRFNLYVVDMGRGMTVKQIKEVSAYMQFDRKIYEQQGLGLGLSIARRLVEQLNGTLKIDSIPGERTTAHVSIPIIEE